MTKPVFTMVAAAAAAVLLVGARPVAAACSIVQGDFDANGTLDMRIRGDAGPQFLKVIDDGAQTDVRLSCNGDEDFTDPTDIFILTEEPVETFDVALGGKDNIRFTLFAPSAEVRTRRDLTLTLGPGGNLVGIDGALALNQGSLMVDLQGGAGPDRVTIGPAFSRAALIVRGDLGAGDDSFEFGLTEATTSGATALIGVDLGLGNNQVIYQMPSLLNAMVSVDVEGADVPTARDAVRLEILPTIPLTQKARFYFDAWLRRGDDALGIESLGTPAPGFTIDATSEARIHVDGGEGNDVLAAALERSAHQGLFALRLNGGLGNDVISLDWNELGGTGGTGVDRLRLDGGEGNDTVMASLGTQSAATVLLDLLELGGRGADTVYQALLGAPNLRFPVSGATVLDGGRDRPDTCVGFGTATQRMLEIDCEPVP
jgi:hypothetical protein